MESSLANKSLNKANLKESRYKPKDKAAPRKHMLKSLMKNDPWINIMIMKRMTKDKSQNLETFLKS